VVLYPLFFYFFYYCRYFSVWVFIFEMSWKSDFSIINSKIYILFG